MYNAIKMVWPLTYSQLTTRLTFFSVLPAELLALHVYIPASALLILLKVRLAVLDRELLACSLWIHVTSGSGFPVAAQLILTGLPSL